MRIAHVTPTYCARGDDGYGGGERYVTDIAEAVAAAAGDSAEVRLVSYGDEPAESQLSEKVTLRIVPVTVRGSTRFDHVSAELPAAIEDCDLVHVHQVFTRSGQVALLTAKFLRKAVVASEHGERTSDLHRSTPYLLLADCMLFHSDFEARTVGAEVGRRVVVPGGVDAGYFRASGDPRTRDFFLFVGHLLPHKGVDRLIEALPPGPRLVVCGHGQSDEYFDHLRELARNKDVTFVTAASDAEIRELYVHAVATIFPSVHVDAWGRVYERPELTGLAVLESLASGTPAIVSATGALPEVVEHARTGVVFHDVAELRAALRTLAGDPDLADAMGTEGRARVEQLYSLEVVGEKILRVYQELLDA